MFLTGAVRRLYREWRAENPAASYTDAAGSMVHEFRQVHLGADIADCKKKGRKKWDETYREYSDRLMQMAGAAPNPSVEVKVRCQGHGWGHQAISSECELNSQSIFSTAISILLCG